MAILNPVNAGEADEPHGANAGKPRQFPPATVIAVPAGEAKTTPAITKTMGIENQSVNAPAPASSA